MPYQLKKLNKIQISNNRSALQNFIQRIQPLINKDQTNINTIKQFNRKSQTSQRNNSQSTNFYRNSTKSQVKFYEEDQYEKVLKPTHISKDKLNNKKIKLIRINRRQTYDQSYRLQNFQQNLDDNLSIKKMIRTGLNKQSYGIDLYHRKIKTLPDQILNQKIQKLTFNNQKIICEKQKQVKNQILQKVKQYVKQLDIVGQQELNQLLIKKLKNKNQYHLDSKICASKIKDMIQLNHYMVKMIKQQLLKDQDNQSINTRHYQSEKHFQPNQVQPSNLETINMQDKNCLNQNVNAHQNVSALQNHQINQITNDFVNQWQKNTKLKKTLYSKFRKTIFQNYPQFQQRQNKINKTKQKSKNMLFCDIKLNKSNIRFQSPLKQRFQGVSRQKFQSSLKQSKIQKHVNQSSEKNFLISNKQFSKRNSFQLSRKSFSNSMSLSKKNSINKYKEIGEQIQKLSKITKQDLKQLNNQNLINYIFTKAYFYSKSQKKVLQNKTPFQQTKYDHSQPIRQQSSKQTSFLKYTSKFQQNQSLRNKKDNLRNSMLSGKFLIKNKEKIMKIQKEGHFQHDFLKKCLQDAIEDYLKQTTRPLS